MGAGGDFRDDAFVGLMLGGLAEHNIGQNMRPILIQTQNRRRGLVAAGFNAEDGQRLHVEGNMAIGQ